MSSVLSLTVTGASETRLKGTAYVEFVLLSATQTALKRKKRKLREQVSFSVAPHADVSGVRLRLYDRRGLFGALTDRFCGECVLRVNLARLRAPEPGAAPLQKRYGHPKDVVSGSLQFTVAYRSATAAAPESESESESESEDASAPVPVPPPAAARSAGASSEFADLIFGARAPAVLAAAAVPAVAAAAPVAPVAAALAPAAAASRDLHVSAQFNDEKIEEALCGASFVIMPKDDECDSVRDGPAAVELQPLGSSPRHRRRGDGGGLLLGGGAFAVCTNVRLLGMSWYCEATVRAVGAHAPDARCRVGVCVSSKAVFVDGAAGAGENALQSSGGGASSSSSSTWCLGDVLSLLIDVDAAHVYCWRHSRGATAAAAAARLPRLATADARLLHLDGVESGVRVFGAVSDGWSVEFNFGAAPFVFRPPPAARTLHSRLADAQVGEAHALFDQLAGSAADEALIADDRVAALQSALAAQSADAKSAEDALLLTLAWRCHASTLWTFTRDEFVLMCMRCGVSSLAALAALLAADARLLLPDLVSDDAVELYNFCFDYLRDEGRVLLLDDATAAWALVLQPKRWALYDDWLRFVAQAGHKAVARDPWQQVLPFAARFATRESLASYDADNSAFNVLFDEFVEFMASAQ
jgi:hypothetical protein